MERKNRTFRLGRDRWDRLTFLSKHVFKREDQRTLVLEMLIDQAYDRAHGGEDRPSPPPAGKRQKDEIATALAKDKIAEMRANSSLSGGPPAERVPDPRPRTRPDPDKIEAAQRRMAQAGRKK